MGIVFHAFKSVYTCFLHEKEGILHKARSKGSEHLPKYLQAGLPGICKGMQRPGRMG